MNTHDIELPSLPQPFKKAVYATSANTKSVRDGFEMGGYRKEPPLFNDAQMKDYATAAIEADRQRRGEPVLVGWAVSINGGGILHASKYTEYEASRAGYPLPLYRLTSPQPAEPDVLPGEAIFGFTAWLTSLKTPVTFSECHGAAIGADLAAAYNKSQGFDEIREDFHKRLKPYPEQEPAQPTKPESVTKRWQDGDDSNMVSRVEAPAEPVAWLRKRVYKKMKSKLYCFNLSDHIINELNNLSNNTITPQIEHRVRYAVNTYEKSANSIWSKIVDEMSYNVDYKSFPKLEKKE